MRLETDRTQPYSFAKTVSRWVACSLIAVCLAAPALSQNGGLPPWLDVAVVQVKGGQGSNFEDLLKEYMKARKAAGLPTGQVFQVVLGHPNEYHIVTPVQSISANESAPPPMSEGDAARWQARIADTVDSVHFFYAATFPQNSVDPGENAPAPKFLMLRKIRVASGKEAEYEKWVADQYMPAFMKTHPLGHTMSRGVYGDSLQNYYHAYPLADLKSLDAPDPLIEILGQRRYDQMLDALDGIVVSHEMVIARIRTDLMAE